MKHKTLVVMAAGMGSRFGGLKQITPVDEGGHVIIDYSVYDAVKAGFDRVVCVIKPENEADFRAVVGDRLAEHVEVKYAYQTLDRLPAGYRVPEGRTKPWGTAHAVLCAADAIDGDFAAINADDYYGRTAIAAAHDFIAAPHAENEHAMVGYRVENTLTENGYVSRGICSTDALGHLTGIVERVHIEPRPGGAAFTEDGAHYEFIPAGTQVSMNLWAFSHSLLGELQSRFVRFLDAALPQNPTRAEYFLPSVPNQLIEEGLARVHLLTTQERWYGITYHDDLAQLTAAIAAFKKAGLYPENLWS